MISGLSFLQPSGKNNFCRSEGGLAMVTCQTRRRCCQSSHNRDQFLLESILCPSTGCDLSWHSDPSARGCMTHLNTRSCKNEILTFVYLCFSWNCFFLAGRGKGRGGRLEHPNWQQLCLGAIGRWADSFSEWQSFRSCIDWKRDFSIISFLSRTHADEWKLMEYTGETFSGNSSLLGISSITDFIEAHLRLTAPKGWRRWIR